jgi:hypothetical protein
VQVGVENGGHGALVLAQLTHHLAGKNYRQVTDVKFLVLVADDFLHPVLVHRVEESPEQRYHETARAAGDQGTHLFANVIFVQGANYAAPGVYALLHANDHVPRNERFRLVLHGKVPALRHASAVNPLRTTAHQDYVFVALGGNQPEMRALFLDQPVHGDGGGVADHLNSGQEFVHLHAQGASAFFNHLGEADGEVVGCGGNFLYQNLFAKVKHQVGESSANINVNGVHSATSMRWSRMANSPWRRRSFSLSRSISIS